MNSFPLSQKYIDFINSTKNVTADFLEGTTASGKTTVGAGAKFMRKTTSANDIYLSESVKIKRKSFHKFDTNISEVYKMLGEIDSVNKPKIYIISPDEMTSNAVASYQPIENILNIKKYLT